MAISLTLPLLEGSWPAALTAQRVGSPSARKHPERCQAPGDRSAPAAAACTHLAQLLVDDTELEVIADDVLVEGDDEAGGLQDRGRLMSSWASY